MKIKTLVIFLALCLAPAASAQGSLFDFMFPQVQVQEKTSPVKFAYDVDFQYDFDNREFDAGKNAYTSSMTINALRLAPVVGIKVNQGRLEHRVFIGAEAMKNMGDKRPELAREFDAPWRMRVEMLMYYNLRARLDNTLIDAYAGAFPRGKSEVAWPKHFLSDSLAFYDSNMEGVLIKVSRPRAHYEIGLDWMGMYGSPCRERFMVSAAADARPFDKLRGLSVGGFANLYHMASSTKHHGVAESIMLNPYVKYDAGVHLGIQEMSLTLSYLQTIQRDRLTMGSYETPAGGQLDFTLRNWNVGLKNEFYYGQGQMPLYNEYQFGLSAEDEGAQTYSSLMYRGSPFYRIHPERTRHGGFYDCVGIFYQPHIADFLDLKILMDFHFTSVGYQGCRQMFSLIFNLDTLTHPSAPAQRRRAKKKIKHKGEYSL